MGRSAKPRRRPLPASRGVASMAPGVRGFDTAADQVLTALEKAERTTTSLAETTGIPRETLSYWLHGRRPLRADYLLAIIRELRLTLR